MTVFLLGSVKELYGVSEREFLSIVDFAYTELRLPSTVTLFFEFEGLEEGQEGFIHNYECNENEYYVIMSPVIKTWEEIVRTIFHELSHVKQVHFKQHLHNTWHGVKYDPEVIPYADLPWEKDAYRLEDLLFSKFILEDTF